jgi:hypothetical protein
VGLILLVEASIQATSNQPRSGGWPLWLGLIGLVAVILGATLLLTVARRVDLLQDGRFRFVAVLMQRCVSVDELKSATGIGTIGDFWGALPFLVRTRSGWVLVDRHMDNGEDLEERLRALNPEFRVNRAWTSRLDRDRQFFDDPWKDDSAMD